MAAALPIQPLERGLVIVRAALVAERAAAAVEALEAEALAAGRNLRLAEEPSPAAPSMLRCCVTTAASPGWR